MSRRKQLNPKPLNKGDCSDTAEEMTVESRDSKDFNPNDVMDEQELSTDTMSLINEETDVEMQDLSKKIEINKSLHTTTKLEEIRENTPVFSENNSKSPIPENTPDEAKSEHSLERSPKTDEETAASYAHVNLIPKLRLNALLASDPALKPDAKDLKAIHQEKQRLAQLPGPPALTKQENLLVEPLSQTVSPSAVDISRIKVFMCLPCGIGFSSPSTLEAHQAYYCSHRNKELDEESSVLGDKVSTASVSPTSVIALSSGSGTSSANAAETISKSAKTGKQYGCTQCSYSADKKVSLNRHMRMHQTSPTPSLVASNGIPITTDDSSSQQTDRYCSDCDIRFNNVKTYRAHKQHYCSSRRTEGKLDVVVPNTSNKTLTIENEAPLSPQGSQPKTPTPSMNVTAATAPQPFIALPTNPIVIIPYSLFRTASLIPGPLTTSTTGVMSTENTCFTLENGALKPLATSLHMNTLASGNANSLTPTANVNPIRQPSVPPSEVALVEKRTSPTLSNHFAKRKEGTLRESAPLDLSFRRSPIRRSSVSSYMENSEQMDVEALLDANKSHGSRADSAGSLTPEQIVCAPSLPNSPSISPSPKRRVLSPRSSGTSSATSMSPPANISAASLAAAAHNMLDGKIPLHSILPPELSLKIKLSEQNLMTPLLTKQNFELALKLSAAAAAVANSTATVATGSGATDIATAAGKSATLLSTAGSAAGVSNQPQIYVKQGVSKCKECNIVFCKYDNYLAHKQRYCSARNQDVNDSESAKHVHTPPMIAGATAADASPVAYQQLICAACGIKYTSLDNLRAHQNYYCPKGGGAAKSIPPPAAIVETEQLKKEKCLKCKTIHELNTTCPFPLQPAVSTQHSVMNQNVYKCPVCDATSLTASESRKHMETHGTVKAFRCTICRYKGNTLRGMRTHIRMHFEKKTADLNEEQYMTCILEDESTELPNMGALAQDQLAQLAAVQKQQQQQQHAAMTAVGLQQPTQIFNCDACNYSSTYKGNVLRHMKLVHPHLVSLSPSISPEDVPEIDIGSDEATSQTGSINGENNVQSCIIKSEPFEVSSLDAVQEKKSPPLPANLQHIKPEPMDIVIDATQSSNMLPSPTLSAALKVDEVINQKYCQTCDISFTYMNTYLAHKQYYCKNKLNRQTETNKSPSPNAASPNALLHAPKNKENIQQEAAI